MDYLVDTNIFLWFIFEDYRLPVSMRKLIADERTVIWLSIISLFEITIKVSKGDLLPNIDLSDFFQLHVFDAGLVVLPVKTNHLLTLRELPFHHKDPFDRLIIAQSLTEGFELLYTDDVFARYF
jgi:PIN domain nuclease of toxin-antitoxin system